MSSFVPKPHTPYQWNGMQTREYLRWAGDYLRKNCRLKAVKIKQHDVECSLVSVKKGRAYLEREQSRAAQVMAEAQS